MNYLLDIKLKLELPEGVEKDSAEIVMEYLMSKLYDELEQFNFESKHIENNVCKIVHIDDSWEDPENKYNWR